MVVYNTDYDEELIAAADVSAVKESAREVARAVAACGHDSEVLGVHGHDIAELLARLRGGDPPDLVFNLCESLAGSARHELVLPALLDLFELPYTGPGPLEIALCLHKERAKDVLVARGIATPPYLAITSRAHLLALAGEGVLASLAYPYFLKLEREDASVGIEARNRVEDASQLVARASELLAAYHQPVIAEVFIDGREVNVTMLGNCQRPGDEPAGGGLEILPLHEIDFAAMPDGTPHIVSYAAKWDEAHPEYAGTLPVPLRAMEPATEVALRDTAMRAFVALGLRDFGRVDLRVDRAGTAWVIDVNPNCDLSPDAGVARAAARAGLRYSELIGRICDIAWRRHGDSRHPAR